MSESNNNIPIEELEQIERFLQQDMAEEEATAFAARMQADERLRARVGEVKLMLVAIAETGLQERLPDYHDKIGAAGNGASAGKRVSLKMNWKIAASVLLLVAVSGWLLYQSGGDTRLYNQYYSPDPGLMTAMSSINEHYEFDKAMVEYKSGAYDKALAAWQKLLVENPGNDTLHYFIGSALQAKGDYTAAKENLLTVANDPSSAFYKDACWYLGLIYYREDNKEKAVSYLRLSQHPQSTDLINRMQ